MVARATQALGCRQQKQACYITCTDGCAKLAEGDAARLGLAHVAGHAGALSGVMAAQGSVTGGGDSQPAKKQEPGKNKREATASSSPTRSLAVSTFCI